MRAALNRVDVINVRIDMFTIAIVVEQGNFNRHIREFISALYENNFWDQGIAASISVKHFYKLDNTAFAVKSF